ncbi:uncharacterized protein LOC131847826 isoform X1 [Achroia grisella]|uniref:uncharacterized protein LOC131847826 isoform X1 n=1 Tax=Achroia grisella TaxID=688607 RepID=UPI0027D2966F|nr:uncharacterized protein LOC131847826 isoform X1 [Achroia grisella]
MSILDVLPVVDKCCCFSLRTGSVLIAIWNIFVVVCHASASVAYHSACKRTKSDIPHNIMYAIEWISIVLDVLVFIASIILLIGIFYENPNFVLFYIYVLICRIVLSIILLICFLIFGLGKICEIPLLNYISMALGIIVYVYFVVVINSYKSEIS